MKKTTHVERQYENKVFLIGQIRRYAFKIIKTLQYIAISLFGLSRPNRGRF